MEVILLEKIRNLGDIGAKVKVANGYARNYLLPQGKAVSATKEHLAEFEQRRAELEKKAAELLTEAKARAEKLAKLNITIESQASEEGKLFGSVGVRDIVTAVIEAGEKVAKHEIILPEGVIRQVGEYEINLQLHSDITIPLKINVTAQATTK